MGFSLKKLGKIALAPITAPTKLLMGAMGPMLGLGGGGGGGMSYPPIESTANWRNQRMGIDYGSINPNPRRQQMIPMSAMLQRRPRYGMQQGMPQQNQMGMVNRMTTPYR